MIRALQLAKLLALLAVCGCCIAATVFVIRADDVLQQWQSANVAAHMDAVLDAVTRPCGTKQPCGTLADVAKTLHTLRGTAGEIEIAAHHEDQRIGVLDGQEAQIYRDTHRALQRADASLAQLRVDLATANTSIAGLQPVESELAKEAVAMQAATASVSALVANPDLRATFENTSHASAALAGIADDTRDAVHSYLHPKWPRKVWNAVTGVGVTALKILW